MSSSAESEPPRASLLGLPAELRNRIYSLVLVEAGPVPAHEIARWPKEPGLVCTNRQLRAEALPVYYGANTFECPDPWTAFYFIDDHLAKWKRPMVKQIRTKYEYNRFPEWDYHFRHFRMMQTDLTDVHFLLCDMGLDSNILRAPIKVDGEEELVWVSAQEIKQFEVRGSGKRDTEVVRKTNA